MPRARAWTDEEDRVILRVRGAGGTWQEAADELGFSRSTVVERGRRLRAEKAANSGAAAAVPDEPSLPAPAPRKDPLPPGHKLTWDALWSGEAPAFSAA